VALRTIAVEGPAFESLVSVGQVINSTLNVDDALKVIAREATQLLSAKMTSLLLLDSTTPVSRLARELRRGDAYIRKPRLSVEESLVGIVVRRKKPLAIENVQTSSRYQNIELARSEGLVSCSPCRWFTRPRIGALKYLHRRAAQFFQRGNADRPGARELSALAIEKARLYERVVDMEEHLRQSEKLSALGLLAAKCARNSQSPHGDEDALSLAEPGLQRE
jgi:transcriptional regulator with GAF, ATPase, and Fis domain